MTLSAPMPSGRDAPPDTDTVLVYAPVPLFAHEGRTHVEAQALAGLRRWADNFARAEVMMPLEHREPPPGWVPMPDGGLPRVTLHEMPTAYRPDQFLRALPATLPRLRALIERPVIRCFAIGGLFGDWGAVAATLCARRGLPHAVWTDRVESAVILRDSATDPWRARLRKRLYHRPMAALERRVIGRATVGLFNGQETFDHYAPMARAAELVHDLSVGADDHIPDAALAAKRARPAEAPLRVIYTGRAHPMKGPRDWLAILAAAREAGTRVEATWLGDGPALEAMRADLARLGLGGQVTLAGFVSDRGTVLQAIRDADVFLFCHRTPESPRCLIEALVSGTPLVGYDGAYARGLAGGGDAAILRPMDDIAGLASALTRLAGDRPRLAAMMRAASARGAGFDGDTVFRHRAEVLRRHLAPEGETPQPV